jgi:two-component system, OmpR family, KDP operon response regulator KdpE
MSNAAIEKGGTTASASPGGQDGSGVEANGDTPKPAAPFALVIDDQEGICAFIAMALAKLGVESTTYQTAKPAIASLDQRRPEIIFLDIALESSDAIDVIKGLSEKRYTGVVQLMSGGRQALLEAVQRIGARYGLVLRQPLQKPFRSEAIRAALVDAGLVYDAPPSISATSR